MSYEPLTKNHDWRTRCDVCNWTLAETRRQGCVADDCSMRPRPAGFNENDLTYVLRVDLRAAEREIERLRRESSPDWMRAERDQAVAESARLRKEIERLRAQVESISTYAVRLLGAMLCERHKEEASKMTFSAFAEKDANVKCHWCVLAEIERLRAALKPFANRASLFAAPECLPELICNIALADWRRAQEMAK